MIWRRNHVPNIKIAVPDWDEPCTNVLRLPVMLLENGQEGYFRNANDGPLGNAAEQLCGIYKALCQREPATIRWADGSSVESEVWHPDEDLLVTKLFGQAYDPDMRIALARCLLEIGTNPAEVIAIGEQVYSRYVQEEADRMMARSVARDQVDRRYGELLPKYIDGEALRAFRNLLITMTVTLGYVPEVQGLIGVRRELLIALKDIEAMVKRRVPRGDKLPEYITRIGRRYFMTLNGLALFGYAELRDWYFEHEDNERVSLLYYGLNDLQYNLLNSTTEGRRVLDNLLSGLFGAQPGPPAA